MSDLEAVVLAIGLLALVLWLDLRRPFRRRK